MAKSNYEPTPELIKLFDSLAARWVDEHKYENHEDYVRALVKALPKGSRNVHLSSNVRKLAYTTRDRVDRFIKIEGNKIITGWLS